MGTGEEPLRRRFCRGAGCGVAEREGAVDQPEVEIEAQRRALESRQGVHVNRYGVVDDLVEELLTEFDLAVPQ